MLLSLVIGRLESQRPKLFNAISMAWAKASLACRSAIYSAPSAFDFSLHNRPATNLELFHAAPQAADPRGGV
jgi:hypothetical protein